MTRQLGRPILFALTVGVALACLVVTKGIVDSDFFWHLATGKLIANTGVVPSTDPFSFTWADQPWNPYSWLSGLILHWLVAWTGDIGTVLVFAGAPAVIVGILTIALAHQGVRTAALAPPILLSAWTLLPYVTLRPQVFSWMLMAVLVALLLNAERLRGWLLVVLPLMTVLWANLHGAWVIGFAVLCGYTVLTLLGRTPMSSNRRTMALVTALCLLAAGFTPAGPAGILYPLNYLDPSSWALENIAEWQSPDFHDATHWSLLVLIVALALNRGRATPTWLVLLPVVGVIMSLQSIRNVPFLAIWAAPTLAYGMNARLRGRFTDRYLPPRDTRGRRRLEILLATVVAVTSVVAFYPADLGARLFQETQDRFPAEGIDRLGSLNPDARVLADYNWGGYVISRLHETGGKVFVDGRDGEMYSRRVLDDYNTIVAAGPGWNELLDQYSVEAILLRPVTPLVSGLAQEAGWCEAYRDAEQVLLLLGGCETARP